MSVKNIIDKILDDAKAKESDILEKANKEAEKIKDCKNAEIESMLENNKLKAEQEGINKRDRLIQNAYLQVRNNKLKAKQEMISSVFDKTLEKLSNLSDAEFVEFVKNSLNGLNITENAVILMNSKKHSVVSSKLINEINGKFSIGEPDETLEDGFVVKVDNVHYNFTFKSIVESMKSDLISEIAKELF